MLRVNAWLVIWATTQALAVVVLLVMTATLYHDVQRPQRDERLVPVAPAVWERPEIDGGLLLARSTPDARLEFYLAQSGAERPENQQEMPKSKQNRPARSAVRAVSRCKELAFWHHIGVFYRTVSAFHFSGLRANLEVSSIQVEALSVIPVKVQAILLAERVFEDASSHNKIIAGTFNHISATKFGGIAGPYWVYCAFTGIRETTQFSLRIVDLSNDESLVGIEGVEISSDDPNRLSELVVKIPIPAPHVGMFCLEVLQGDVVVGSLRFQIDQTPGG